MRHSQALHAPEGLIVLADRLGIDEGQRTAADVARVLRTSRTRSKYNESSRTQMVTLPPGHPRILGVCSLANNAQPSVRYGDAAIAH